VNLYGGSTKLIFYYRPWPEKKEEELHSETVQSVAKLLTTYGGTLYNKNHGKSFDDCYIDSNEYSLKNRKGQFYPIKTNLNEDNMIILNSEELCLFEDINYLKSIGIFNFSIDARWKSLEYIEDIGKAYRELIDEKTDDIDESKKTIDKHCPNLTKANFDKGLK
jgi:putative protease